MILQAIHQYPARKKGGQRPQDQPQVLASAERPRVRDLALPMRPPLTEECELGFFVAFEVHSCPVRRAYCRFFSAISACSAFNAQLEPMPLLTW